MRPRLLQSRWFPPLFFLLFAVVQLFVFLQPAVEPGKWFFFGRDTLAHDAVVHLWIQQWMEKQPATIPLWMPGLQGGLPTIGAFLWTPLAPNVWPLHVMNYADAQRAGWLLALWIGGMGAYMMGRAFLMRRAGALYCGLVWMLCGHVVTLIHAGHFQKVMALGWLPWMIAGAAAVVGSGVMKRQLRGAAIASVGLGMMLLSGHPQIAYTGIMLTVLLVCFRFRRARILLNALLIGSVVLVGLCIGAAQFIPGAEMASLSNRAGGITFEEAAATSYPPGEILEFIVPRVKGSSLPGDEYTGEWGERIVSDYIGRIAFIIALIGVASIRRQPVFVVYALSMAVLFLIIGLGKNTFVYGVLFDYLPGFSSFRSPGTFMAATSLMVALLAGAGVEKIGALLRARIPTGATFAIVCCISAFDVGTANRHFLMPFSWEQYQREFINPNELDMFLADEELELQVHDTVSNLSLRPLLFGRRAMNGYHPVFYREKMLKDEELGFNTLEWFSFWGVSHLLVPAGEDFPDAIPFVVYGRALWPLPSATPYIAIEGNAAVESFVQTPNQQIIRTSGESATVRVKEILAPGMNLFLNGELMRRVVEPELHAVWTLPAGTNELRWIYMPFSWRLGIFLSSAGLFFVLFILAMARRHRGCERARP